MSSPAPYPSDQDAIQSSSLAGMPTRLLQVKLLYTFDDQNQTNHLIRLPEPLRIPTVPVDNLQEVGLIELRQCIRAVVSVSPEIVGRLSQGDFTIYAYDYSEYETPLVGQGMLSSLLAALSSTPGAPAHQSKTMITGRVCQSLKVSQDGTPPALLETLEVKLRLVPVPKPVQQDYVKSMEIYRNFSPALSGALDPNTWSSFSMDNNVVANLEQQSQNFTLPGCDQPSHPPYHHQRHMSSASMIGNTGPSRQGSRPSSRTSVRSERQSRPRGDSFANGPDEGFAEEGPARKRAKITQTDWRGKSAFGGKADSLRVTASTAASIRVHKPVATRPDIAGGNSLEPPPRVPTPVPLNDQALSRAKSLQASLLRRESSLYQAQTPGSPYDIQSDAVMSSPEDTTGDQTANGSPVDIPSSPPAMPEPSSPELPMLPRAADSGYMSGNALEYLQDDDDVELEKAKKAVKPRARRRGRPTEQASETPKPNVVAFVEQTPGPVELLPTRMQMSDTIADTGKAESAVSLKGADRRSSLALPPRPTLSAQASSSSDSATSSRFPTEHPLATMHNYAGSSGPVPTIEGPNGVVPPSQELQGHPRIAPAPVPLYPQPYPPYYPRTGSVPRSAAASPAPTEDMPGRKPRSGGGAKRKKVIKDKLMESLASGAMPTYCSNCGAIETPTWRTLYVRTVDGAPEDNIAEDQGDDSPGIEILECDETSKTTKYRLIRSARKAKDAVDSQKWQSLQVCNPCGLWFNKFKYMRPAEKWNRSKMGRRRPQKKVEVQSDAMEPPSDYPQSDFPHSDFPHSGLWTDQIQPEDTPAPEQPDEERIEEPGLQEPPRPRSEHAPQAAPQRSALKPRANSMSVQNRTSARNDQWSEAELDAALQRAIQSSPARFLGTQESPIELEEDLTPKPTRRLLFPTPRKDGEVKSLDDTCLPISNFTTTNSTSKTITPSKDPIVPTNSLIGLALVSDKENLPPHNAAPMSDEDFAHLFSVSPSLFKTPSKTASLTHRTPPSKSIPTFENTLLATPTPTRRVLSSGSATGLAATMLQRTPGRTMDEFLPSFSSAEKKLLGSPSRWMQFSTPVRGASGGHGTSGSGSGSGGRGAGGIGASAVEMTPFTRSLAQMLNDNPSALDFGDLPAFDGQGEIGMLFSPGSLGLSLPAPPGSGSGRLGGLGLSEGSGFSSPQRVLDWELLATPKKNSPLKENVGQSEKTVAPEKGGGKGDAVAVKIEEVEEGTEKERSGGGSAVVAEQGTGKQA